MGFPVAKLLPLAVSIFDKKKKSAEKKEMALEVAALVAESVTKNKKSSVVGATSLGAAGSISTGAIALPEPLQEYALLIQGVLYVFGFIALFIENRKPEEVNGIPVEESKPE